MQIRLTREEFITRASAIHRNKYEYSKVVYVNRQTQVVIICPTHGEFKQRAARHLAGSGCHICRYSNRRLSNSEFIQKSNKTHNGLYGYSKVEYVNSKTKVTIICKDHGEFLQQPDNHLMGDGCPSCGGSKQLTTDSFTLRAKMVHGATYDYSSLQYVNNRTRVTIICPEHGEFEQVPKDHLNGNGCPSCATTTSDRDSIYILRAEGQYFNKRPVYKIGITSKRLGLKRVAQVTQSSGFNLTLVHHVSIPSNMATQTEAHLHLRGANPEYQDFNGCTEYRALSPVDLQYAQSYLQMIGATPV